MLVLGFKLGLWVLVVSFGFNEWHRAFFFSCFCIALTGVVFMCMWLLGTRWVKYEGGRVCILDVTKTFLENRITPGPKRNMGNGRRQVEQNFCKTEGTWERRIEMAMCPGLWFLRPSRQPSKQCTVVVHKY